MSKHQHSCDFVHLLASLELLRRRHDECEDCWYSCPKSGECCNDDLDPEKCNCGADRHNERLDEVIAQTRKLLDQMRALVGERSHDSKEDR